jgi:hypothetical protein
MSIKINTRKITFFMKKGLYSYGISLDRSFTHDVTHFFISFVVTKLWTPSFTSSKIAS